MFARRSALLLRWGDNQAGKLERSWRVAAIVLVVAVSVARAPHLLKRPRFWAEEGSHFFAAANCFGLLENPLLLERVGGGGYVNLPAVLGAHLATASPVEHAPLVTTMLALCIQLLPHLVILFGDSLVFDSQARKLAGSLLLLVAPLASGEIWLNTINSQVHLGALAVVLLVESYESRRRRSFFGCSLLLFMAVLGGAYAAMVLPAFLLRSLFERTKRTTVVASCGCTALAGQLGIGLYIRITGGQEFERTTAGSISDVLSGIARNQLLRPLLGNRLTDELLGSLRLGPDSDLGGSASLVLLALILLGVALVVGASPSRARIYLGVALATLLAGVSFLSSGGAVADRYMFVSGMVIVTMLIDGAGRSVTGVGRIRTVTVAALLVVCAAVGVWTFRGHAELECVDACAEWPEQVAQADASPTDRRARIAPLYAPKPGFRVDRHCPRVREVRAP